MSLLAADRPRPLASRPSRIHVRVGLEPGVGGAGSGGGAGSSPGYPIVTHVAAGIIGRSASLHLLPAVHLAAPRAGGLVAVLDEFLEVLHRVLDPGAEDADRVGDVLHDPFRLVCHLEPEGVVENVADAVGPERLEADGAGVVGA